MRRVLVLLLLMVLLSFAAPVGADDGLDTVSADLSVVVAARPSSSGSNGGGGGGSTDDFNRASSDGDLYVSVPAGTIVRNASGNIIPSYYVQVSPMPNPPPPPEDSNIIGLAYDLQPSGATFSPPIPVAFTYDPNQIPEGISESGLVVAFWDGGQWVELECVVDTITHTITADVAHFTVFAVLATVTPVVEVPTPAPPTPEPEQSKKPDIVITIPPVSPKPPDVVVTTPSTPLHPEPTSAPVAPDEASPEPEPSGMFFWVYLLIVAGLAVIVCCIWWYKRKWVSG